MKYMSTNILPKIKSLLHRKSDGPLRLAFVITWYGKNIGGGAEAACRSLATDIVRFHPEIKVDVITTTLKEFAQDWNTPFHPEGVSDDAGVTVRRFHALPHDRSAFAPLNQYRLMPHIYDDLITPSGFRSPLTPNEESEYIQNMVVSPGLLNYLKIHRHEYDYFLFLPYMFASSCLGAPLVGSKAIIIPCLHNERYAYMDIYRRMMQGAKGSAYLAGAEMRLSERLYQLPESHKRLMIGLQVDTNQPKGDPERFRAKYQIKDPFILYAGRKIEGKNLPLLVDRFLAYKTNGFEENLKLVLIGAGDLSYPSEQFSDIIDLGFVSVEDKRDAFCAATIFCQPSENESFSIVMMEAWLQGTPNLVSAACDVTKEHCEISQGGLWFSNQQEFNFAINSILTNSNLRVQLGTSGCQYVKNNFKPEIITHKLVNFLTAL